MSLQQRIDQFCFDKRSGYVVPWDARFPPIEMSDQALGRGPYISKWDTTQPCGEPPTEADGFTTYELGREALE